MVDAWSERLAALGRTIRGHRERAELSLRDLARLTDVSNPYLSQIERGLHEPSLRILKAIAAALDVTTDALLMQAGMLERDGDTEDAAPAGAAPTTENAIRNDPMLDDEQRDVLLALYRTMRGSSARGATRATRRRPRAS